MRPLLAGHAIVALLVLLLLVQAGPAVAAPEGTLTWGLHVTLATKWLDPSHTEAFINPFMVLYAIHDALVKPMPAGDNTPSLAESWTVSKDGLTYEFVMRKGVKFHNGDPVTAEDVRFSFERYRGAAAKLLKERVPEQWDPKSPWHDRRVRLAASYALDREALNQAETLGLSHPTGGLIPRVLEFSRAYEPPACDAAQAKKLLAEAGFPSGFDAGDLTPFPPYFSLAEAIGNYLQAVGIVVVPLAFPSARIAIADLLP